MTEVDSDFHLFEHATNKHFNKEMNKQQRLDGATEDAIGLTKRYATKALEDIKEMLAKANLGSPDVGDGILKTSGN